MKSEKAEPIIPEIAMRGASVADVQAKMAECENDDSEITHREHEINLKVSLLIAQAP